MKPTLVFMLLLGCMVLSFGNESRLSSIAQYDNRDDKLVIQPAEEEQISLYSRWIGCLSGDYPMQKSMSVNYGLSYDPNNDHDFLLVSFQWRWKYRDVWGNRGPDSLYFRLEGAGGARLRTEERGIISCGAFAQHYFEHTATDRYRFYLDGGIGIIYTDFQNKDQGLRVNFNPRISFGTDILSRTGSTWFLAVRLSHLSNAELHEDNRGVNIAMIVLGRYF